MNESVVQQSEELKQAVSEIVKAHVGRANAIKARKIANSLGLTNDRLVREAIRQLRKDGRLILSSVKPPYGYFIAESLEEWIEFRDTNLKPRALDILHTSRAMGRAATVRFGRQMSFQQPPSMIGPFSRN